MTRRFFAYSATGTGGCCPVLRNPEEVRPGNLAQKGTTVTIPPFSDRFSQKRKGSGAKRRRPARFVQNYKLSYGRGLQRLRQETQIKQYAVCRIRIVCVSIRNVCAEIQLFDYTLRQFFRQKPLYLKGIRRFLMRFIHFWSKIGAFFYARMFGISSSKALAMASAFLKSVVSV